MTSKYPSDWPRPLVTKPGELGDAVRAYAQDSGDTGGETASFAKVMARLKRRPRHVPAIAWGVAVGALATAAGFFLVLGHLHKTPTLAKVVARQSSAPSSVLPPPRPAPAAADRQQPAPAVAALPALRLSDQPVALPLGDSDLVGQARATLSVEAVASASAHDGTTEIALQRGSIELHVLPHAPGQRLVVVAGHHRFTDVGTVFSVSRIQSRLELRVQEGAVAVARGTRQLAVVRAGGHWNTDEAPTQPGLAPAPAATTTAETPFPSQPVAAPLEPGAEAARQPTPPPSAPPMPPAHPPAEAVPAREDCRQLVATRRAQEAVGCYQQQSLREGLAGETATYELARLWRDTLGQPDRALTTFQTQRSRFPAGVLRREADLSIIELLPRLGRHAEALAETQRFLAAHPGDERKGEIYLLRGNIYREAFRDLSHAQLEYAVGAVAKGRAGDDSRFFHAVCLEALGKPEEARAAYEAYLHLRGGAHSAEAKNRLSKLAQ